MTFLKITINKILFLVAVFLDLFFLYMTYRFELVFWKIILPIGVILMVPFKYYHFLVCYKIINRRNVNLALVSVVISTIYLVAFYGLLFLSFSFLRLTVMSIMGFINFVVNVYFAINIYFMKSVLYFDVNIPVDGYGIDDKVNQFGNAIPGL